MSVIALGNVLSLFDGISCGQLALNKLGVNYRNYFSSEIDPFALKVTSHNFPNTKRVGDVTLLNGEDLPKIDLLIGGSPCQGFSSAGKHLNFNDPRSKLFFEFVRLLREVKPKYFLLENVVMKKSHADMISDLLETDYLKINSSLMSAQSRNRLYWFNWDADIPEDMGIVLNSVLDAGWQSDRSKSYCIDANYGKGSNYKRYFFRSSRQIVFREGYFPNITDESTANQVMHEDNKHGKKWWLLNVGECERLQTIPCGYVQDVDIPKTEKYKCIGNGWTVDVISHLLAVYFRRENVCYSSRY
jgi:site-specific DNA-cytosine methylase